MSLTFDQLKELIAYGQELGLQQLQTEGLVVVYGARAVLPGSPAEAPNDSEVASITALYAAIGKDKLRK